MNYSAAQADGVSTTIDKTESQQAAGNLPIEIKQLIGFSNFTELLNTGKEWLNSDVILIWFLFFLRFYFFYRVLL